MLTNKQSQLLTLIRDRLKDTGIAPSYDEMATILDLKSKSGIHRLIVALEERGFVRRIPNRARAIEIIRLPEALSPSKGATTTSATKVSVIGCIGAGTPISAMKIISRSINLPAGLISDGEYYGLEVRGDSMCEASILDGDIVIIKKQSTAESGDIIVAYVDGTEVALKRLRIRGASVALESANAAYETRIFGPGRVAIQGKLVGLIRKY